MKKLIKSIIIILSVFFILGTGFGIGYMYFNKPINQEKDINIILGEKNDINNEKDENNQKENNEKVNDDKIEEEVSKERPSNNSNVNNDKTSTNTDEIDTTPTSDDKATSKKIAYLTFDDGPSPRVTPQVLDILKKYNVKATFFVIGDLAEQRPDLIKRAEAEGHLICNHTYSHNYKYIYASTDNFIKDLRKGDEVLKAILGNSYTSNIIRFPGGSYGAKRESFKKAVKDHGYEYVDWDALSGDAEGGNIPANKLVNRVKSTVSGKDKVVILNHDANAKQTTADALPEMIEYLQSQGYIFKTLETSSIK